MSRKAAAAKIAITGIISSLIVAVFGFFVQKAFISTLGIEVSGLNGVFTNIISVLTMADFGVSTAIVFNLYKPLVKDDKRKIAALMQYYHKCCLIIGILILAGGLLLLPFLSFIIKDETPSINIYFAFSLFVCNALFSYVLNYKRVLLQADQKSSNINLVVSAVSLVSYSAKLVVLYKFNNYYLFIICNIVAKIIEDLIIWNIVDRKYPYIHKKRQLDKNTKADIAKKIKASIPHNISSYVVYSTDSLLLTYFFGSFQTGLYVNYSMIISAISIITNSLFNAVSAGMGNILAKEGRNYLFVNTKRLSLFNYWVYATISIALFFCAPYFIRLWLGEDLFLSELAVAAIAINFFLNGIRVPINSALSAAGILHENRFVPVAEAIINFTTSIVLAKLIGVPGIFIGTIISTLYQHLYNYPKYAYELVFKQPRHLYLISFGKRLVGFFTCAIVTFFTINLLPEASSSIIGFVRNGVISCLVPSLLILLATVRSTEFKYFYDLVRSKLSR